MPATPNEQKSTIEYGLTNHTRTQKVCAGVARKKGTKPFCQLARTNAHKPHKTNCCPTPKIARFPVLAWQQRKRTIFSAGIARKAKTPSYFASLARANPNQFATNLIVAIAHATRIEPKLFWQRERELNFRLALQEEQKLQTPLPAWHRLTPANLHFNLSCQNSELSGGQNHKAAY